LKLSGVVLGCVQTDLHWLKILLRRIGKECTLKVWENAYKNFDDAFLQKILGIGWSEVPTKDAVDVEQQFSRYISRKFPAPVEDFSADDVRLLLEKTPPIFQIKQLFPNMNMRRDISTYDALHLLNHGLALLVESLMDLHGKEGELLAYDIMLARVPEMVTKKVSSYEFLSNFLAGYQYVPTELDIYSAGLETKIIKGTKSEVIINVVECEFSRYYREHHPRVGFMMACSLDHANYSAANENIWVQRTSTIMEGGDICNIRVQAVREAPVFYRE